MTSAKTDAIDPYEPPTAGEIALRQDTDAALRLLISQRKLYSKGKRFLALRMWGMGVIAIAAPLIAFIWPDAAVAGGAIAGAWLALGRTFFKQVEERHARQGAAVQELFDAYVFKMPNIALRPQTPPLEEI